MEIWKDIPGYEGKYQASNLGRIKSLKRRVPIRNPYTGELFERTVPERILRPGQNRRSGHLSVVLGHGKNASQVHQLVMTTFEGPCPSGMEVLHINGNPKDNRCENLRYGTRRENILDVLFQGKPWRKLTIEDAEAIKFGLHTGIKGAELARMYGVSQNTISSIKKGKNFSWT